MGGVSESGFAVVSNAGENGQPAGIFSGLVSSSNNGGFASVSPACFLLVPSSCNHVEPSSNHVDPSSDHVDFFSNHVDPSSNHVDSSSNHLKPSSSHVEPVHSPHVLVGDRATSGCYIVGCSLCAMHIHHAVRLAAAALELPKSSCMQEQGISCIIPDAHSCVDLLCQLMTRSCTKADIACVSAASSCII